VEASIAPVRPLAPPWRRVLLPGIAGLLLLATVPVVYGLRFDAATVGPLRLWGGSLVQIAVGLLLVSRALAESIPGRLAPRRLVAGTGGVGLLVMVALTGLTFLASPTQVPPDGARYFEVCATRSLGLGLVPLLVGLALLARGLLVRPLLVGALLGLGAGLLADASWRLYCEVSDPAHVLTAHLLAVVGNAAAGATAAWLVSRWAR
jgi:hypothetical protein